MVNPFTHGKSMLAVASLLVFHVPRNSYEMTL